ncbi:unnamed protein product, partial [Polarella glacialis]
AGNSDSSRPSLGSLADKHLLNVAVSRGRVGLVALGCPEVLRSDRNWAAFIEHCKSLGGVLEASDSPCLTAPGDAVSAVAPAVRGEGSDTGQPQDPWREWRPQQPLIPQTPAAAAWTQGQAAGYGGPKASVSLYASQGWQ